MACSTCCENVWQPSNLVGDRLVWPMRCFGRQIKKIFVKNLGAEGCIDGLFYVAYRIVVLAISLAFFVAALPFGLIGMACKSVGYLFSKSQHPANEENFLSDLSDTFITTIAPLCISQVQLDHAVHLCLYLMSLKRKPEEDAIIREVIGNFFNNFDSKTTLPPGHLSSLNPYAWYGQDNGDIDEKIVNLGIQVVEKILGKQFQHAPLEVAQELAVRLDTYFHGTSINAVDSIKLVGLSRFKRGASDRDDIEDLQQIAPNVCKHYNGQPSESIYVSQGASTGWEFAKRTPEWLASFFETVSGSQGYYDTPFFADRRNKQLAMQNVNTYIANKGLQKHAAKIQMFAKKYWEKYTGPCGAVLVVRRNRSRSTAIKDWLPAESYNTPDQIRAQMIHRMHAKTELDQGGIKITDQDFLPEDITIFRVPFHNVDKHGHVVLYSLVE